MENNNTTTAEAQQATTQPEENGAQSEKTFTQDEVNKIVSDRLAREKAKAENNANENIETTKAELQEREAELSRKENEWECNEYIRNNDFPPELLEVFDTSDAEAFKEKVEKLRFSLKSNSERLKDTGVHTSNNRTLSDDKLKSAFGLK